MWYSSKVLPCPLPIIWSLKIEIRNLDNRWDFVNIYAYQKGIAQLKSAAIPFFFWIYQFLMSFRSITYTNDLLAEFNIKMTVSKSGYSYKILQYLAEPSKVLQICCSSFKFLWNWANTAVNLCAALKTESLFSLVSVLFTNNSDATLTMQETEDNFSHE